MSGRIFTPPAWVPDEEAERAIFLGGAIGVDAGRDWQAEAAVYIASAGLNALDPRPEGWDRAWRQGQDDVRLVERPTWELAGLERSACALIFLPAAARVPASLLDVGLCVGWGKRIVIAAEPGYWRRGDLEVIARRYAVPLYASLVPALARAVRLARGVLVAKRALSPADGQ